MGHAILVRGSAAELRAALENQGDRDDLLLIIPDEHDAEGLVITSGPENAKRKNGVALFPTEGLPGVVTSELVRRLLEESE